jgi:hypothetical protein
MHCLLRNQFVMTTVKKNCRDIFNLGAKHEKKCIEVILFNICKVYVENVNIIQ